MAKPTLETMEEYYSKTFFIEETVQDLYSQGLINPGWEDRKAKNVLKTNYTNREALKMAINERKPLGTIFWWATKKHVDRNLNTAESMLNRKLK